MSDDTRVLMFAHIYREALDRWLDSDDPAYAHQVDPAMVHAQDALVTAASGVRDAFPFTTLAELDRWLVSRKKAPDGPTDEVQ